MRKNFLLLMLMALLPLASWAQKEVTVTLYDFTIQWGADEPTVGTLSTDAVKYEATPALTPEQLDEVKSFLTFSRVDDGSANWNSNEVGVYSWTLTKAVSTPGYTIYLSSNNAKMTIEKIPTAWTTAPAIAAGVDYDGESHNLLSELGVPDWGTAEFSIDGGNTWASGMPTASAVATYTVKARVLGDAHHSGIDAYDVAGTMTINGINITEFTAPTQATGLKYTGEAQDLLATAGTATGGTVMYKVGAGEWSTEIPQGTNAGDYVVSWMVKGDATHNDKAAADLTATNIALGDPVITAPTGAAGLTYNKQQQALLATNGSVTLGATLTYDVSFNGGAAENKATANDVKGMDAGAYTITPKVAATANTNAVVGTPFVVNIAQKDLYIYVQDKTKVYDGAAFDLTTAVIEYNGLIAGDALTGVVSAQYKVAGTNKDKGVYVVTTSGGVNENYNIHRLETGKFTITARPITLTAKDQTITFGDPVPAFAKNDTYIDIQPAGEGVGLVDAGEQATVLGAIESVGLKEAKTDIGTYTGNIIITKKATAATDAPNYEISVLPGTYKINPAGGYTLIAQNKTVTYGQAYAFTYLAPNGEPVKDVEFDVYKGEEKLEAIPTDFGTYTIKVHPDTYAPANFGGAEAVITYIDGTLTIEKKELTIAPKEQTLRVGKKATDLVASMVDFDGVVAGDEGKIDYTLDFNGVAVDGEGKLTTTGTTNDGIKAVLSAAAEGNRNANYTLSAASVGKLIVVNEGTLVLGNNEASDLADIATYDGATVKVKINLAARNGRTLGGERNWVKENWVTLTLPFDITVADLSQALGYAIVNVIDPEATVIDGTGSKFYGKLTMKGGNGKDDVLAANKPILVKIADDIANVGTAGVVDFGTQKIVAPADKADLTVDAGKGAKFIGTYASKNVTKDDEAAIWFMIGGGYTQWAYITTTSANTWTIKPFEAYIDMSACAPEARENMTFYFEELDGSTTAIKCISSDNLESRLNVNAEGWYTLDGMKLQGAPTQKGIYINNGKKVIIK